MSLIKLPKDSIKYFKANQDQIFKTGNLAEGKWNLKDFKKAFLSRKRKMCAPPAPAHGLFLTKIKY